MSCIECAKASECHNNILNDIQIVECIRMELDKNHIEIAKDELTVFINRLRKRNLEVTGRGL